MRKKLFTIALLSLFNFCKAQTNSSNTPAPILNTLEKPHGPGGFIKTQVSEGYNVSGNVKQKSDYNNWESEILKELSIDYIPKSFPVYKATMTDEEYKSLINNWVLENPSLLKQPK